MTKNKEFWNTVQTRYKIRQERVNKHRLELAMRSRKEVKPGEGGLLNEIY